MKKLCIVGTGGTAQELLGLVALLNKDLPTDSQWKCIGFLDDNPELEGGSYWGLPVLGKLVDAASLSPDVQFAFVVGSPRTAGAREQILDSTGLAQGRFPAFIHPQAIVSEGFAPRNGVIVLAGAVVSASAQLSEFSIVLSNAVVNHDATVGAFTCLATGVCVSGAAEVGADAYLGANAALRDGIKVGRGALIGLGSAVVSDIPDGCIAYGVPAKIQTVG